MKQFKSKILSFIIPIFLAVFAVIFSVLHIIRSDFSFSVLTYTYPKSNIYTNNTANLQKGDKITGQFTAKDDYMGVLTIKLETFGRSNQDYLRFRIKEKNAANWYHVEDHYASSLTHLETYPFGFPIIAKSNGKTYVFEFESLNGRKNQSIALSKDRLLQTKHNYPKAVIISSAEEMASFAYKKTLSAFFNFNLLYIVFVYSLPLILYFNRHKMLRFWLHTFPNRVIIYIDNHAIPYVKKRPPLKPYLKYVLKLKLMMKNFFLVIIFLAILFDIIFVFFYSEFIIITLLYVYITFCFKNTVSTTNYFIIGLVLLTLCPFAYFINLRVAIKCASWSYIFFIVGTVITLLEAYKRSQPLLSTPHVHKSK